MNQTTLSQTLNGRLETLPALSVAELLTLQEQLTHELRAKTSSNGNGNGAHKNGHPPTTTVAKPTPAQPRRVEIPGTYRITQEEVANSLASIFTPEELAHIGFTDFSKIHIGPKSASEMLNEDREDRF